MKKTLCALVIGITLLIGCGGGGGDDPQTEAYFEDIPWDDIHIDPPPTIKWCYEQDVHGNWWKVICD